MATVHTVTSDDVTAWNRAGTLPADSDDRAIMDRLIDAVASVIERDFVVAGGLPDGNWTPADEQALIMEAARLWARRGTPEGIGVFGVDGVIRVTRADLDVERLLSPRWGFA